MKLGDRFAIERGGVMIYTDTVEGIHYSSGAPAIYRNLNLWQWMLRRLTPRRWRKSLLIRPAALPSFTINGEHDPVGKTIAQLDRMKVALDCLNRNG